MPVGFDEPVISDGEMAAPEVEYSPTEGLPANFDTNRSPFPSNAKSQDAGDQGDHQKC